MSDLLYDFKAWLKVQDPTTPYSYVINYDCALAKYLKARGYTDVFVTTNLYDYVDTNGELQSNELPEKIDNALCTYSGGRTFGALLKRLEYI